jgi:hypothetical protein
MSKTLHISDDLYERLEHVARQKGLSNIEQLLESWQLAEDRLHKRREAVDKIDALRNRLFYTYGQMPDSADLIREDRGR